jgi:hypothetical protein
MIEDEEDKNYVGTFSTNVNRHRNQNVSFFLVVLFRSENLKNELTRNSVCHDEQKFLQMCLQFEIQALLLHSL